MIRSSIRLCGLALLLQAAASIAQPPKERDWGAAVRQDAQALHDDIAADHPGPVNAADPGFALRTAGAAPAVRAATAPRPRT